MKAINLKNIFYLILTGLFVMSCGEERLELDYNEYDPTQLNEGDGALQYNDISTYPIVGTISSEPAIFDNEGIGVYKLSILGVEAPENSTYKETNFSIDPQTGVISYKNAGELSAGIYHVTVTVDYTLGVTIYSNVFTMGVLDVPVSLEVDNPTPTAGIFEDAVVATVAYTDTSGAGLINSVSYELIDAPVGFSIDVNSGEISKTYPANSGENAISVKATTNLGAVISYDICVVTVGEEPTIEYVQSDGTTPLTNVVMSPWTAYTTAVPILDGMVAASYEIILPATIASGSVIANADGSIEVLADQNIETGVYSLGVIATNSGGISVTYEDVFTITVENRWESMALFYDTFDDGLTGDISPGNLIYPDYAGYSLGAASNAWSKAVVEKTGKPTIEGIRVQNPGTDQHYLVKSVDITGVKVMQLSFEEQLGYNDNFVAKYNRGLYIGESTSDLDSGSFDPGNWVEVMASDDARWGGNTWQSRIPDVVSDVAIDLSTITGNTLKLTWFIGAKSAANTQNGQYIIDSCTAQYAVAFPGEEE